MSAILVAPSEPPALKKLGKSSALPESYGVDFLWSGHGGLAGVQRKELGDLVASLRDGRLAKEMGQMKQLTWAGLVVEGHGRWTGDGQLVSTYKHFTRKHLVGVLSSVQADGVKVYVSGGLQETAAVIPMIVEWTGKSEHGGLVGREPIVRDRWGTAVSKAFGIHLLCGLPGVGPKTAEAIWDKFGRVPWRWDVTDEQLLEVDGVGKGTVEKIRRALG